VDEFRMKAKKIVGVVSFIAVLSIIAVSFAATNDKNKVEVSSTSPDQSHFTLI